MAKAIFIPSVLPATVKELETQKIGDQKSLTWWKEDSIFRHDYFLMSAAYGLGNFNRDSNYENAKIFIDSGGFQVARKGIKLDPLTILKFQEENGDFGFILDIPPFKFSSDTHAYALNEQEVKKHAELTLRNAEIMEKNRTRTDFKLYNILSGISPEDMRIWYKVIKDLTLDGIAYPLKKQADPIATGRSLSFFLSEIDSKNYHVLAVGGKVPITITVFAANVFGKDITFDSSVAALSSRRLNSYFTPLYTNKLPLGSKRKETLGLDQYPCSCPVCSEAEKEFSFEELSTLDTPIKKGIVELHNLFTVKNYTQMLSSMAKNERLFFLTLKKLYCQHTFEHVLTGCAITKAIKEEGNIDLRIRSKKTLLDYLDLGSEFEEDLNCFEAV